MKRKRASTNAKLKAPLTNDATSQLAENYVINNEAKQLENVTSVHMEAENPRTSTSTTIKRDKKAKLQTENGGYESLKSCPKALSEIIVTVLKEISKEAGGLANFTKTLVDNSSDNEEMEQPHADMDLQENLENQSQDNQNSEYNKEELKSALTVIRKTMKLDAADPFNKPVDPIELGIPDYFDVIDTPMDFGTICINLEFGLKYMNSGDVFKDVQYIWNNCVKYNKKGNYILDLMKRVKASFMKYWKAAGLQTPQLTPIVESSSLKEKDLPKSPPVNSSNIAESSFLKEKDLPPSPHFNNSTQKEAGPIEVAEIEPSPINMQTGQSQSQSQGQGQGQSQTPQSPSEQDDEDYEDDHDIYTPDSRMIQKLLGKRIKITTNELGQPVGPEACKLTSYLGVIARDGKLAPLIYPTWTKMPEEYKENIWQKVLTRYDIEASSRSWVMMSVRTKWRNFKSKLKVTHYDVHETDEERLKDCDERVLPDQWAVLVSHWSSEKSQFICARNKANRQKLKLKHTTGRKSFARLREEERAKRPDGQEPSQAELFILTRTRKNGQPVNEATAAVISKLCDKTNNEETSTNNKKSRVYDAYKQVMGQDTKGGVSLYSLCGTPCPGVPTRVTRVEALKMVEEKNLEVLEMKQRLKSVEETCSNMAAQMSQMVSMMASLQKSPPIFVNENVIPVDSTSNLEEPSRKVDPTPTTTSNHEVPAKRGRGRPKKR